MAEVIELRGVLEVRAAELAVERATPDDVGRLAGICQGMEGSLDSQEGYIAQDLAFHREVVRMGGNRLMLKLFDLLEPMLAVARVVAFEHQHLPEGMLRGIDEHRAIVAALANRASEELREAVVQHLAWARDRVGTLGPPAVAVSPSERASATPSPEWLARKNGASA
jgi:GntR family transcriptional regulator, transcriptional repressor for pyruvate dehydrogenase complex